MTILPASVRNLTDDELFQEAELSEHPVALALAVRLMALREELATINAKYTEAADILERMLNNA